MFHQRKFVPRTVSSKATSPRNVSSKDVCAPNCFTEGYFSPKCFNKANTGTRNKCYLCACWPALIISLIFLFLVFGSAVVLDIDLPKGEGRKTALGEAPWNRCRPASALCPDMARGENQMSTSTDNNAYIPVKMAGFIFAEIPSIYLGLQFVIILKAFWRIQVMRFNALIC